MCVGRGGGVLNPTANSMEGAWPSLEVGVVIFVRGVAMRHCRAPKKGAWSLPNGWGCGGGVAMPNKEVTGGIAMPNKELPMGAWPYIIKKCPWWRGHA